MDFGMFDVEDIIGSEQTTATVIKVLGIRKR